MNDRSAFWRHYREQQGGFLDEGTTDDGSYQPWIVLSSYNSTEPPAKLLLVPARHANPKIIRIPYLQLMLQEFDRDTGQLCLMFPSSDMTVFIEGRGLEELDAYIEERRVKSIHMFDDTIHAPIGNDAAVVTNITVERSQL